MPSSMASSSIFPNNNSAARQGHGRSHSRNPSTSSLSCFTVLELERDDDDQVEIVVNERPDEQPKIPASTLVLVTETNNNNNEKVEGQDTILGDVSLSSLDFFVKEFRYRDWDGIRGYSDYIAGGLQQKRMQNVDLVMLFENPKSLSILEPCCFASMNGTSFPVFLKDGTPPAGLMEHWADAIPGFQPPTFTDTIASDETVYPYLPVEMIRNHLNDPVVQNHLAGKGRTIHMMTQTTTQLLPDTRTIRPCVVKTTHSKGIFLIQNDDDEAEFEAFLEEQGRPNFVVTAIVDLDRLVTGHFFIHPDGSVTWFGSHEHHRGETPEGGGGSFGSDGDAYLVMEHQERLKEMEWPFVEEVAKYCCCLGFWGFCGIDVLFDSKGLGYLVDINPRVTKTSPALMTLRRLHDKYGFSVGLFRRGGNNNMRFRGTWTELFDSVGAYNDKHEGKSRIVIHSAACCEPQRKGCDEEVQINIGVYGNDLGTCKEVLNSYAKAVAG